MHWRFQLNACARAEVGLCNAGAQHRACPHQHLSSTHGHQLNRDCLDWRDVHCRLGGLPSITNEGRPAKDSGRDMAQACLPSGVLTELSSFEAPRHEIKESSMLRLHQLTSYSTLGLGSK